MEKTQVTMTFDFKGTPEEAREYLRTQLPNFGSQAIDDFIDGNERWTVEGQPVEIEG